MSEPSRREALPHSEGLDGARSPRRRSPDASASPADTQDLIGNDAGRLLRAGACAQPRPEVGDCDRAMCGLTGS